MSLLLSIIVPCFNEEDRLRDSLPVLKKYLVAQDFTWEVIFIDDGGSDDTARVPFEFFDESQVRAIRYEENRGKGYAVKRGILAAQGELILLTDADFSTPIQEWERLHACLKAGEQVVIGSRSLPGSRVVVHQAWVREFLGKVFNKLIRVIVLRGFIDTQCGFKLFRREVGISIFKKMTVDRFCFDVEFLFIAKKWGLKIRELPVEWHDVLYSRVQMVRDSSCMILDAFRICWNDWRGRYEPDPSPPPRLGRETPLSQ